MIVRDKEVTTIDVNRVVEDEVARARQAVEQFVAEGRVVYGITTGFGAFKDRFIPADQVHVRERAGQR